MPNQAGRILAWVAVAGAALAADGKKIYSNSYMGKAPPELVAGKGHWINAQEPPTLAGFKGKVVWLEFGYLH